MNVIETAARERPDFRRLAPRAGSRVAVVGGCGGIGRAVVAACLENDLEVAVLDLEKSISAHAPPEAVRAIGVDATDPTGVDTAFAEIARHWGGIDVLIFLVGFTIVPPEPLQTVSPDQWNEVLSGNLQSAWLVSRAAVPLIRAAGGGAIVNMTSSLGIHVLPGFGPYAAAKAGLIALTKGLAVECAPDIRVNAVAPTAIDTDFVRGGTGRPENGEADDWFDPAHFQATIPLGRLAEPEDVVGPTLFLASDAARFVTGQTLQVNGGRWMG